MTTENLQTESTTQEKATEVTNKGEVQVESISPEDFKALQANYKSAVSSRDKYKQQVRELEESAKGASEWQTKFDALQKELEAKSNELTSIKEGQKQKALESALSTALEAAGAKSVSTVMKLIDKSKIQFNEEGQVSSENIETVVKEVMASDPILFGDIDPKKAQNGQGFSNPDVKRVGDGKADMTAYQKELQGMISKGDQKGIIEVMRKYGITQ